MVPSACVHASLPFPGSVQVAARLLYPDEVPPAPQPPTASTAVPPKPSTVTARECPALLAFHQL